jgi:putative phage-type endonuclease
MLTEEQIATRRKGITATDMAALSGVHPYRRPINVYMDKMGKAPPFEENERVRWGNILEPVIRNDYAKRKGLYVREIGTVTHESHKWAMATPDGIAYRNELMDSPLHGLEIKTHSVRVGAGYGQPGTDRVPGYILVQVAWNMFVSGLRRWDVVAFVDGVPRDYTVHYDEALVSDLYDIGRSFLTNHVEKETPPPPDGSESYSSYLSRILDQRKDDYVSLNDNKDAMDAVAKLRELRALIRDKSQQEEQLIQSLKVICGEHAGLEWTEKSDDGKPTKQKITWKRSKDGKSTDWEAVASVLVAQIKDALAGPPLAAMALLEKFSNIETVTEPHTKTKMGARPFVTPKSWSKDQND